MQREREVGAWRERDRHTRTRGHAQLARAGGAELRVIPLSLDAPTADFTQQPALTEQEFLAAVAVGYAAVSSSSDLVCLGEMGIGEHLRAAEQPAQ